ncbi:hypothetical protein [Pontixanthobacter sp. CEM42]|uniref:hypothetical protein n=1 Tax=Pontixanthobacter sp. CEM42 TaxID=2792077 RepID=UPI001ADF3C68|nr:hypothetical protein [Pontixanthobacter sp. CEM42]
MKPILSFSSLLLLAACGNADNEPGPGGVSVGEARALDEAAEMIEAKRIPEQDPQSDSDPQPEHESAPAEEPVSEE